MGVTVTKDITREILARIKKLTSQECLVGVPDINAEREPDPDDEENDINNAELGYIHEFGAPEANIPPRPFLVPGVESIMDKVTERLKKAGAEALNGNIAEIDKQFTAIGLLAVTAVQTKMDDGPFIPLKPRTIADRVRRGRTGIKPLEDTGALRQAITYVIRDKGK